MKLRRLFQILGPGLMYAGAAIGVSHLVQSTRAGALYDFQLLGVVCLANILKYPFFETGSRFSGATGKSLIYAYHKQGKWVLWFYLLQTFFTMFIIQSALTIVTAGLSKTLFRSSLELWQLSILISLVCTIILVVGHISLLKSVTKVIVISLTICTLIAVLLAAQNPVHVVDNPTLFSWQNAVDVAFVVALIGWMPAPIDISVWQSVWRVDGHEEVNLKNALLDFHVGYWGTAIVAIAFMALGALVFFNSGEVLQEGAVGFATQLVNMYTSVIGQWAWPFVAIAAFATMFSTCLTCLDANPRVMQRTTEELNIKTFKGFYLFLVILSGLGAVVIPLISGGNMTKLVDFATTVSFLTAPIFATLNYRINFGKLLKPNQQPGQFNRIVSWIGILFLYGFAAYYLWSITTR